MKTFSDKLRVKVDEKGRLLAFNFGGNGSSGVVRRYPVSYKVVNILSWWREPGRWWEGEPVKFYLRLQAAPVTENGSGVVKQGAGFSTNLRGLSPRRVAYGDRIFELYRMREEWYFHRAL